MTEEMESKQMNAIQVTCMNMPIVTMNIGMSGAEPKKNKHDAAQASPCSAGKEQNMPSG